MAQQNTQNPAYVTFLTPTPEIDIKDPESVEDKKEDNEDLSLEEALSTL